MLGISPQFVTTKSTAIFAKGADQYNTRGYPSQACKQYTHVYLITHSGYVALNTYSLFYVALNAYSLLNGLTCNSEYGLVFYEFRKYAIYEYDTQLCLSPHSNRQI